MAKNYQIRWQNFRSFKDTGWIELKPITLVIGPNNVGKTSLAAPLLLMAQTLAGRDALTPLVLDGDLISTGNFRSLVLDLGDSTEIKFGIRFPSFQEKKPTSIKPLGTYAPGRIELTFRSSQDSHIDHELKSIEIYDRFDRHFARFQKSEAKNRTFNFSTQLPISSRIRQRIGKKISASNFLFTPNDLIDALNLEDYAKTDEVDEVMTTVLPMLNYTFSKLRQLLVFGLSYLGPLREAPHRFYANDRKLHPNVGSKGQHSANIIRTFSAGERKRLDGWLNQFEFGKALVLEGLDADAFSLRLETFGGLKVNITDVGFGLSQTLPLIVQSIANDDQDLIIAEQPEIHLNPKLQGTLADLFTSTISQGTHYLVETHSEHLVLRLRSLIAEGKLSADDLGLYFVEKESGYSTLHTIPVDNTGAIQEWPKGFFQDGLSESLRLSRLQAKARKS